MKAPVGTGLKTGELGSHMSNRISVSIAFEKIQESNFKYLKHEIVQARRAAYRPWSQCSNQESYEEEANRSS